MLDEREQRVDRGVRVAGVAGHHRRAGLQVKRPAQLVLAVWRGASGKVLSATAYGSPLSSTSPSTSKESSIRRRVDQDERAERPVGDVVPQRAEALLSGRAEQVEHDVAGVQADPAEVDGDRGRGTSPARRPGRPRPRTPRSGVPRCAAAGSPTPSRSVSSCPRRTGPRPGSSPGRGSVSGRWTAPVAPAYRRSLRARRPSATLFSRSGSYRSAGGIGARARSPGPGRRGRRPAPARRRPAAQQRGRLHAR